MYIVEVRRVGSAWEVACLDFVVVLDNEAAAQSLALQLEEDPWFMLSVKRG
jgi:hypothetical protein